MLLHFEFLVKYGLEGIKGLDKRWYFWLWDDDVGDE